MVAVANMSAYNARIEEENKAREVAKKKAAIEKELEEEINKRKTVNSTRRWQINILIIQDWLSW